MKIVKYLQDSKFSLLAVALLLVGASAALVVSQQNQENRSQAAVPPPVFSGVSSARGTNTTSFTFTHTMTTNPNRLLLVAISLYPSTVVSSVKYDGVNLTKVNRKVGSGIAEELWYLAPVASTGTKNVVITLSSTAVSVAAGATSFYNVDQANPLGANAGTAAVGKTVSTTLNGTNSDQLIMNAVASYSNVSATTNAGQTPMWNLPAGSSASNLILSAGSYKTGASGSTLSGWTLSTDRPWVDMVVAVNPMPIPSVTPTLTPTLTLTPTPVGPTATPTPTPVGPTVTPTPALAAIPILCPQCNFVSSGNIGNRLSGKDFTNAFMPAASFQTKNLSNSNFTKADFSSSVFNSANLSNSNFTNADFTDADLTGATTTGAIFTGAIWNNTICPDGTNSNSHSNTCVGHL